MQSFLHTNLEKEGDGMESAKRRIRVIMVCVVLTAVIIGMVYYYHETQNQTVVERGTLIAARQVGWWNSWLK